METHTGLFLEGTMRRRKAKTYTYTRGALTTTSTVSQADAKREAELRIDWLLRNTSLWIEKRWNLMIVIYGYVDGFRYQVFDPCTLKTGLQSNFCTACSVCYGTTELWRVIDGARSDAAQRAWHKDVDDALHIARSGLTPGTDMHSDLSRWIGFQRRYLHHKDLGRSDNDAWRLAAGDPSFVEAHS